MYYLHKNSCIYLPTGMLISLTLLFDLLIDHTLYTDIDNGVSTDDSCQQWCHKDAMYLDLYSY